jgi:hypothetical protein
MRGLKLTRDFYIPKEARLLEAGVPCGADVYVHEKPDASGKMAYYAVAFAGKCQGPVWNYRFRTDQSRQLHIDNFIACRKAHVETKARRAEERKRPHPLKVGDILHTSWGYDQTNVEFFEVIRVVSGRTVELREIAQKRTETGWCTGTCKPIPGAFLSSRFEGDDTGKPIIRRASHDGTVRIDDVRHAWLGGGEHRWSSYA